MFHLSTTNSIFLEEFLLRSVFKRNGDRQRVSPVHYCTRCGGEIYPGRPYWRVSGRLLCQECAAAWALEELVPFRRTGEEAEP